MTKSMMPHVRASPDVHGKPRLMLRGVIEVVAERVEILAVNQIFREKHKQSSLQPGMTLIKDSDNTPLGRHFYGEYVASKYRDSDA